MLAYFGQAPIIARSSSLLEDSSGTPSPGSTTANTARTRDAGGAARDVPQRGEAHLRERPESDAMTYRRARGWAKATNQMAILVQRVSGTPYRQLLLPDTPPGGLLPEPLRLDRPGSTRSGDDPPRLRLGRGRSTGREWTTPG